MEVQKDFRDLFELLNAHQVEYMIVGAYALAFHGAPRYTGYMDIFIKPEAENARRILAALNDFGFGSTGLSPADFEAQDRVIQLGYPPVRIDIMTSLTGISWAEAFSGRVPGVYADVPVYYIGREQLIKNKRALGRKKDLADLEALGED
jgi:hypothetical protein